MIGSKSLIAIQKTLDSAYQDIRKDVDTHLDPKNDISTARELLSNLVPTLVENKGKLVCTTLENNLTDECINALSEVDPEKRIAFRDEKRERFNTQFDPNYPHFNPRPDTIADTALKYGGAAAAGGISAMAVVYFALRGIKGGLVLTLLTFALTPLFAREAYRAGLRQAEPQARNSMSEEVENYLGDSRARMEEALKGVANQYDAFFIKFCQENDIQIKGESYDSDRI